jgi:hypothetical protein
MLMRDYRVFKPDDRPDVEVLVDGAWCDGELRMWTQREDGSWWGNVAWRPPGEHTRRLGTFLAEQIRRA